MVGAQSSGVSHQVRRATAELARWAVDHLTAQVNEAMPGDDPDREADRRHTLNRLRSDAHHALYQDDGPLRCLLSFLAVVTLRPIVRDWKDAGVPPSTSPLFNAAAARRIERRDLWDILGKAVEPAEKWWATDDGFFGEDPEPPKIAGKYPAWTVHDDLRPYGATPLGHILPALWSVARERKWGTTSGGTSFNVPTKFPWPRDVSGWTSPEHRAFYAALCWAWEQAEVGRFRHGVPDAPRFVLGFRVVPRGHDPAWDTITHILCGHDRTRRRAFVSWRGEQTTARSPEHLIALVGRFFESYESIELLNVGLPERLHFHFGSRVAEWPWKLIGHHDLSVLARAECDGCIGLGYTIDAGRRAEQRVVQPCPDCCGQYLDRATEDSAHDPWPRTDDDNFERYSALRQRLGAGRSGVRKGKGGRKPPEIKVTVQFVETDPADMAARRAQLQKVFEQVEQRRRDAEKVTEAVKAKPRPRMLVDAAALAADFLQVAALAGVSLDEKDIQVETLPAPHQRPKRLPAGKQAVYVFCTAWDCLMVGKAGPNTEARYTSQHYSPRGANSTLARSLLQCDAIQRATLLAGVLPEPTEEEIGSWVQTHTTRHNFLIPSEQPAMVLTLLETFLQCRLKPKFEQKQRED